MMDMDDFTHGQLYMHTVRLRQGEKELTFNMEDMVVSYN